MAQSVTRTIRIFPDHESMSRAAAEGFVYFSNKALEKQDELTIALSGGETPRRLYQILASECIERVQWNKIQLYWGDERYVPQRDKRSNFYMFHETLLYHLQIPLGNIHPMPTHRKNAADAARDYERYMRSVFEGPWPRIDMVMLGMGVDGHIASIFPGSKMVNEETMWVTAVEAPAEPPRRLTFTLPVFNAASDVCIFVSGSDKSEAVRQALTEPVDPQARPAGALQPADGQLIWWLDDAAFSRVDESKLRDFEVRRHSE